jgi:hypothetical protein
MWMGLRMGMEVGMVGMVGCREKEMGIGRAWRGDEKGKRESLGRGGRVELRRTCTCKLRETFTR